MVFCTASESVILSEVILPAASPGIVTAFPVMSCKASCKVYQKFAKSVSRPKVTLPKASLFHEIVTMDLKSFGSKYVILIIDSFNRFVEGKVIQNKRVNTIVNAVMDMWIMCFGIPIIGFCADKGIVCNVKSG